MEKMILLSEAGILPIFRYGGDAVPLCLFDVRQDHVHVRGVRDYNIPYLDFYESLDTLASVPH